MATTKPQRIRVGVVGITGYSGAELSRILIQHPNYELVYGSSRTHAGKRLSEVYPNLAGLTALTIAAPAESGSEFTELGLEVLFLALPHGASMALLPTLPPGLKVIDLGGDYRLSDKAVFEAYYKIPHLDFARQGAFVYGLPENNREAIAQAQYVANPGCFATATELALYSFCKRRIIGDRVVIDAKTGSSGSGVVPSASTHHPSRSQAFYAYKMLSHQHVPEIEQLLKSLGWTGSIVFQAHSTPLVRGLFVSCYAQLKRPYTPREIDEFLAEDFAEHPFVRLVNGSPDVNYVRQSNFADIGYAVVGCELVVFCAIDNLVKGAAGQAVQNLNLMCGLPETSGLLFCGGHPS